MAEIFQTFQNFNNAALAVELVERLKQQDIPYLLEENKKFLDPAFSNDAEPDISIKLKPQDFVRAGEVLGEYYKGQIDGVDKDYYLFEFTDEELMEIVSKPDEWGHFDYQLAQKILKERDKEIKPEVAALLKAQRINELAKLETVHKYWIYLGYVSALLGGLIGIFIGWTLAYYKKTLPNGQRLFAYREDIRDHGVRILLIASGSLVAWVLVRWWYFSGI